MDNKVLAYLRAIGGHSGQWTWYQLDRFLSAQNVRLVDDMTNFLAALERDGFVAIERREDLEYYAITDKGKQALAAATSK